MRRPAGRPRGECQELQVFVDALREVFGLEPLYWKTEPKEPTTARWIPEPGKVHVEGGTMASSRPKSR